MPGVVVTTATRLGPSTPSVPISGTFFVAGQTERGPTDRARLITGLAEYREVFGSRVTYGALYDAIQTFFEEGGGRAVVARVVGPAATRASGTMTDRAGTPLNTLRVEAKNPGAWGARLSATVDGTATAFSLTVLLDGSVVETFAGLSSPADVVTATANSSYVVVTNLGSATAAPNNSPGAQTITLTGGTDDRAAITTQSYLDALNLFSTDFGTGVLAIPGQTAATVGTGLRAAAVAQHRVFLTSAGVGASSATATAQAAAFASGNGSEYGALIWPSIKIPGNITITPEPFAAAARARAIAEAGGPWQAPAGQRSVARWVTGTETSVDRNLGDTLDNARVSAIREIAGTIRLYGWRSLSSDVTNYSLLTGRDVLNIIHRDAEIALEPFVFATLDSDGRILAQVEAALVGLLEPIAAANGFFSLINDNGEQVDPGYVVDVGPGVNTPTSLANNTLRAVIGVRVAPVATLVELTITKAASNATL